MHAHDVLQRLVEIPSPTGSEADAVGWFSDQARADGLIVTTDAAGNFRARAGRGRHRLLFLGHIDTVPGTIRVRIDDGQLWGRGSVDAKGPLVAAYAVARKHVDDPDVRIEVVGAVDEEGSSRGAQQILTEAPPTWAIVGEPSGSHALTLGYKGILRGTLRVDGPRRHGAHAEPSVTEEAIAWWGTLARTLSFAPVFDSIQGRLDAMTTSTDGLHDVVNADFSLRVPPASAPDDVEQKARAIASARDLEVAFSERIPGVQVGRRGPIVAAFLAAVRDRRGTPRLLHKTGTSDMNLFHARFPGVPVAAFGPGDSALDHGPDERVLLQEFDEGVEVLDAIVRRLARREARTHAEAEHGRLAKRV